MVPSAETSSTASPKTIQVAQPQQKNVLADMLRNLGMASGRPLGSVIGDFAKASIGPGKLSFDEYVGLCLYDTRRYAGTDIRSFAGLAAMQKIWRRANYRTEFHGLITNKIAVTAFLEASGLPIVPIEALYSATAGYATPRSLHTKSALKEYLETAAHYPLFGKPMEGFQSLGSASFSGCDTQKSTLVDARGAEKSLDTYVDEIATHYANGYIFQKRVSPHTATKAICGDRLSTVRVVTILTDAGPKILCVCEKLPAGGNVADNYWRSGNLLVQLDPATGVRGYATSGKGFELREHSHHPDTGVAIRGTAVPNWNAVCDVALEASRLLKDAPLMGWDIAPVESGAIIVDANDTPDFMLPQLADRKGILGPELEDFLARCRLSERAWKRDLRRYNLEQYRASFWN